MPLESNSFILSDVDCEFTIVAFAEEAPPMIRPDRVVPKQDRKGVCSPPVLVRFPVDLDHRKADGLQWPQVEETRGHLDRSRFVILHFLFSFLFFSFLFRPNVWT